MSTLRRRQEGFTLVELMIAMTLSLVVISATLSVFAAMERRTRDNQNLNDEQLTARVATDTLARRLRNLASPADPDPTILGYLPPQPLERAEAQDLIFRTVSSEGASTASNPQNLERYRYCLATATGRLYAERQTWTGTAPAMPTSANCGPGDGWPDAQRQVVAQSIVNGARPVFLYQVSPTPGTYSEQTSVSQANFPSGIAIRTQLYVDPDTAHPPSETSLTTRVFLRNQNRPPIASFTVTPSGLTIVLNGSTSEDPEGNPLSYQWTDNGTVISDWSARSTYVYKPAALAGAHVIGFKVRDVGNLSTAAPNQTVTCQSNTSC